jgi:nicotinamidase-related amidase
LTGAPTFTKGRSDSFSNPALDAHLRALQVDELLIVGLDAAYCVKATTRGALNRGYKVTVVSDGVATESGQSIENLARSYTDAGARVATTQGLLGHQPR